MPRIARIVLPGVAHHVTQRGNNRQPVFFTDDDRRLYLSILAEETRRHGIIVLGYCLMTNHTHLLVVPTRADGLAHGLGRTHWRYAQAINRLHGRCGHLWQSRFYSAPLEDEHLPLVLKYIELNPIRARMCRCAWRYAWSSASVHCAEGSDQGKLLDMKELHRRIGPCDWKQMLSEGLEPAEVERVRRQTYRGRPLASDRWIAKLEARLGRRLRPLPVGRPRRQPTPKVRGKRRAEPTRK